MPRLILFIAALLSLLVLPAGAQTLTTSQFKIEWQVSNRFRLFADPKRLFTRYCIEPWFLIGPALGDVRAALKRRAS